MRKLRFTSAAIASIENIGAYTQERWGIRQRDHYLNLLDYSFHRLAKNPALGSDCSRIASGLHRYSKEKHVIFYRIGDNVVTIIEVLHERMNPLLHIVDIFEMPED